MNLMLICLNNQSVQTNAARRPRLPACPPAHLSSQTSWPPWSDLLQTALPHGSPSSSGHVSPGAKRPWWVWQPEWWSSCGGPESAGGKDEGKNNYASSAVTCTARDQGSMLAWLKVDDARVSCCIKTNLFRLGQRQPRLFNVGLMLIWVTPH